MRQAKPVYMVMTPVRGGYPHGDFIFEDKQEAESEAELLTKLAQKYMPEARKSWVKVVSLIPKEDNQGE